MHMDWSHWWYKQAADVVLPLTALAIGRKMSDKHTSSSIIQVKNLWKTISVEGETRRNKPTRKRVTNCWHTL